MRTVWKYEIKLNAWQAIDLPTEAQVLSVALQNDKPCIWVLVNAKAPKMPRHFHLAGTGQAIARTDDLRFIGTFLMPADGLVFHLFEDKVS